MCDNFGLQVIGFEKLEDSRPRSLVHMRSKGQAMLDSDPGDMEMKGLPPRLLPKGSSFVTWIEVSGDGTGRQTLS